VHSHKVRTNRLNVQYIESGPSDGIPVVMVHGNLSTGRFFEHLMPAAPDRYRIIAPDMRGFGDTERAPIDATRGLRDWADDTFALVQALGITQPVHLVGWSTGGAAIANYAVDRPVASLTFVDPVSPYGFGGVKLDGTPCFPDYAGSGGGTGSVEFTKRIAEHDTSSDSPFSPRNVINSSYWAPTHRESPEREEMLLDEILKSVTGDDGYPGDATPSPNWPTIAPGTRGILNALSPKYCNWSDIVDLDPKPPVLWTHGTADIVVADPETRILERLSTALGNAGILASIVFVPASDSLGMVDEALEGVEYRESLKPLLEQLPPREKKILLLRFFGNMTQSQIAAELGISQMHVSRLLARTLAQLRDGLTTDD